MLLRELYEQGHCLFVDSVPSWQEAIRMSCVPLVKDGSVEPDYADAIISCVEEYGPYIVFFPGFALPHTQQGSSKAHKTALSFMKTASPVEFILGDPEKTASVFFAVSATDGDAHLENMQRLFNVLSDEELCAALLQVSSTQELLELDAEWEGRNKK